MTRIDARLAAALGCRAEVDTEARDLKYPLPTFGGCEDCPLSDCSECPRVDFVTRVGVTREERIRCPSSEEAFAEDSCVMVPFLFGRIVEDSSDPDSSPESSDSDEVESPEIARFELRCADAGERWNDGAGDRKDAFSKESTLDGGRSRMGGAVVEVVGEPAALLRAAISRNAATDIRCDESDATLSFLGRGRTGGSKTGLASVESADGDSGRICRNDLRLKDSEFTSRFESVGGSDGFDFLRSR